MTENPRTDTAGPKLERLRKLAELMDSRLAVPGTSLGLGLDALLGLIPVVGDIVGLTVSLWIVSAAVRAGAAKAAILRMLINIIIDAGIGSVPLLGDVFDVGFRANLRNVDLLEADLQRQQRKRARWPQVLLSLLLILFAGLALVGAVCAVYSVFTGA